MKYLIAFFAFLSSCTTLTKDPSPSSQESSYPTAEIIYNNEVHYGMKVIPVSEGKNLDELDIEVQGYFDGVVRFDSKTCELSQSISYIENSKIKIPLTGNFKNSCVITVLVTPNFPRSTGVKTQSFQGYVLLKLSPKNSDLISGEIRLGKSFSKEITFPVRGTKVSAFFSGCGVDIEFTRDVEAGFLTMNLNEVIENRSRVCVLNGVLITDQEDVYVTYLISRYSNEFLPMSVPSEIDQGNKKCYTTDLSAAVVLYNVGGKWKHDFSNTLCESFKSGDSVRFLTTAGRNAVGIQSETMEWLHGKP